MKKRAAIVLSLIALLAAPARGEELPAVEEIRAQTRKNEKLIGGGLLMGGGLVAAAAGFCIKDQVDANDLLGRSILDDNERWLLLAGGGLFLAGTGISLLIPDKPERSSAVMPGVDREPAGKDIGNRNRLLIGAGILLGAALFVGFAN